MQHKLVWVVLFAGLALAGCSTNSSPSTSTTTSTSSKASGVVGTAKWAASNGGTLSTLGSDIGSLTSALPAAVSSHNLSSVSSACQKLASDVTQAQSVPPIPKPTLQKTWFWLLVDLYKAAQNCNDGVAQNSASLLTQASSTLTSSGSTLTSLTASLGH